MEKRGLSPFFSPEGEKMPTYNKIESMEEKCSIGSFYE